MGTYYYVYLKSDYETINNYFNNRPYNKLFAIDKYELLSSIRITIGKSSSGWKFCLHIYPSHNINKFDDWKNIFNDDKIIIVN